MLISRCHFTDLLAFKDPFLHLCHVFLSCHSLPQLSLCPAGMGATRGGDTLATVSKLDPTAYLRWHNLLSNVESRLTCVFPLDGCITGGVQLVRAVALCRLRPLAGAVPLGFCARDGIGMRVEAVTIHEPLLAGSVPNHPVHMELHGHRGGGKGEWEGCGNPGLEQTASSLQGLSLCWAPYGAVFHSRPCEIRFSSS